MTAKREVCRGNNERNFSLRVSTAILSLIICALFVNIQALAEIILFPERLTRDISQYEKRFKKLREILPAEGAVGYISDEQEDKNDARYQVAQYALAPVIVARSLEQNIIIGNFSDASARPGIYEKGGLVPIRDFGGGLVILTRENK
jgi:hypothetical protein